MPNWLALTTATKRRAFVEAEAAREAAVEEEARQARERERERERATSSFCYMIVKL